jgi:hypothetical protein
MNKAIALLSVALCSIASAQDTQDPATIRTEPLPAQQCANRAFQGIPGIAFAPGGRVWVGWYGGRNVESEDDDTYLATSGDGGRTWTDPLLIVDAPEPVRCFDGVLWRAPDGKVWLFWGQAVMYQREAWTWAMVAEHPDREDGGWGEPFKVVPGIMMNQPIALSTGEWLLTTEPTGRGVAQVWASEDQGKSFTYRGGADVPPAARAPLEHMIVERSDGSLWMLVRTTYGIGESVSQDRGKTWTEVAPSAIAHPSARFHLRKLNSGRLLLIKHGPIDIQTGREQLMAFLSDDDGQTWQGGLMLDERPNISYPDGCQSEDGIIGIVYDNQRTGAKEILAAFFTEEDVLAGKPVSDQVALQVLVNKAGGLPVWHPETLQRLREQFAVKPDREGVAPDSLSPAGIKWENAREYPTRRGMTVRFPNRDYRIIEWPARLAKTTLFRDQNTGRAMGTCQNPGLVYVVTPSHGRHPESAHESLLAQGFQPTPDPEFILFYGSPYVSRIYWKQLAAGERLDLGPWSLVLLPEGGPH